MAKSETKLLDGNSGRIPTLDGIRGVAVLLVLFHHLALYSGLRDPVINLDDILWRAGDSSRIGVDLFFVLSGFLITGILFDSKRTSAYFTVFYGRRILRIFPLYFGFLGLLMIVPVLLPSEQHAAFRESQWWYWLYLSNVHIALDGWADPQHLGHFWTLAVEEQFYLLWPLVVWLFNRRQLLYISAACIAMALAFRVLTPFGMSGLDAHVLLPTRMDSLAAGAFLALLLRGPMTIAKLRGPALITLGLSAMLIASLWWNNHLDWSYNHPLIGTIGYSLVAVACASLIAMVVDESRSTWYHTLFSSRALVALGKYSYGIYVFHHPIIIILRDYGLQAGSVPTMFGSVLPGFLLFTFIAGGLTLIVSIISFHYWELPFLKLKKLLPYGKRPAGRPQIHIHNAAA